MKILTKKIVIPENPGKLENYSYTFTCPKCNNETTIVIDDFRNINGVVSRWERGPIDENGHIQNYTFIGDIDYSMKCGCCSRSIPWPLKVIDDFREIAKQVDACEVYANIFYAVCYIIKHCQQSIKGFKLTDFPWIDKIKVPGSQYVNNDIYFTIEWKDDTPDMIIHNVSYNKLSSDEIEEVVMHIKSITFNDSVLADMIGLKFQFLTCYTNIDYTNFESTLLTFDRENRNKCHYDQRNVEKVNQALQSIPYWWNNSIDKSSLLSNPYWRNTANRAALSDICNNPKVGVDNDGE